MKFRRFDILSDINKLILQQITSGNRINATFNAVRNLRAELLQEVQRSNNKLETTFELQKSTPKMNATFETNLLPSKLNATFIPNTFA